MNSTFRCGRSTNPWFGKDRGSARIASPLFQQPEQVPGQFKARIPQGREMEEAMSTEYFVGIDVSKDTLDVCVYPTQDTFRVPNSPDGVDELIKRLKPIQPRLVVFEATGGYETLAVSSLWPQGFPWWSSIRVRFAILPSPSAAGQNRCHRRRRHRSLCQCRSARAAPPEGHCLSGTHRTGHPAPADR